jgi:hypothetical protein
LLNTGYLNVNFKSIKDFKAFIEGAKKAGVTADPSKILLKDLLNDIKEEKIFSSSEDLPVVYDIIKYFKNSAICDLKIGI